MHSPIIVALDYPQQQPALQLLQQLDPQLCRVKVGKEMYTRLGPSFVEACMSRGFDVFLDLKFHDIPNTVAGACRAGADLGVWMMNVHASGGRRMMQAAREAVDKSSTETLLIAVTILTSLSEEELAEVGFNGSAADNVSRLAALAESSGMHGVVCSPREARQLRSDLGDEFLLVTPGVRPAGSDTADQRRVMTPQDAMQAGSSYLVIGRPITAAEDPLQALQQIADSLA
ncbi:MAG: orotidine-5'-phosphate decarboxylase [Pseudomonadota bacterium]|nr:orotidine-5'-phosphate decarboxylase [Pseudomonadota bacterium]